MGIPSYFHSIIRKKLNACFSQKHTIDYLAIDFNCAIHGCVRKVDESYWTKNKEELEDEIIRQVIIYLDYLIQNASPQKGIGIFVDGPVHLAKMKQQRDRRFKKDIEKNQISRIYERHGKSQKHIPFDTNAITPGTLFMKTLCNRVREHLYHKYKKLSLAFSGDDVYGEGEHKCFAWIRSLSQENTFCIYGLDADLIMLSLLHCNSKSTILLQREVVHFGKIIYDPDTNIEKLLYFHVSEFSKHLIHEYRISIEEYIVLCFFMGNDFIPHHPGLEINKNGIEKIIEIYQYIGEKIVQNGKLQWGTICKIFAELSKDEYSLLLDKESFLLRKKRLILTKKYETPFLKELEIQNMWPVIQTPKFTVRNNGGYRRDYCQYLLENETDYEYLARMYFGAIQWTYDYYFHPDRIVSTEFHYPFDYAPLFFHMYQTLQGWITEKENIDEILSFTSIQTPPISTLEQRLMVLPKQSHHLIHECNGVDLTELEFMYQKPEEFHYMFKHYGWSTVPKLQPLSLDIIREFVAKIK